jgi:hypothetical protein
MRRCRLLTDCKELITLELRPKIILHRMLLDVGIRIEGGKVRDLQREYRKDTALPIS